MKRFGNLYSKIYDMDNLRLADDIARKGKSKQPGVIQHDKNKEANLLKLHEMLKNKTFKTSKYTTFIINEGKEREIFRLPYFPDRIVHHAIMNVIKKILVSTFISQTYSCIEGRGIHAAERDVKKSLLNPSNTLFCLKLDVRKFYPSVNHSILKTLIRRKIKDNDTLWLLDGKIDSTKGLPIGNYLSQHLANFYLCYFDHWIKEIKREKHYFRYADDMVFLSGNKPHLHQLLADIREYLNQKLQLDIKHNYQLYPVASRGIDFVGYVFRHNGHTRLRKRIKQNFARRVFKNRSRASIASSMGWAKHGNCKNLIKKLIHGRK